MATEIDAQIGSRLREARLAKGMSQVDLASAVGISFQQVQKYEWGHNRIGCSRIWDISQVLEVSPECFFVGLGSYPNAQEALNVGHGGRLTRRALEVARAVHELEDDGVKLAFIRLIKAYPQFH